MFLLFCFCCCWFFIYFLLLLFFCAVTVSVLWNPFPLGASPSFSYLLASLFLSFLEFSFSLPLLFRFHSPLLHFSLHDPILWPALEESTHYILSFPSLSAIFPTPYSFQTQTF